MAIESSIDIAVAALNAAITYYNSRPPSGYQDKTVHAEIDAILSIAKDFEDHLIGVAERLTEEEQDSPEPIGQINFEEATIFSEEAYHAAEVGDLFYVDGKFLSTINSADSSEYFKFRGLDGFMLVLVPTEFSYKGTKHPHEFLDLGVRAYFTKIGDTLNGDPVASLLTLVKFPNSLLRSADEQALVTGEFVLKEGDPYLIEATVQTTGNGSIIPMLRVHTARGHDLTLMYSKMKESDLLGKLETYVGKKAIIVCTAEYSQDDLMLAVVDIQDLVIG